MKHAAVLAALTMCCALLSSCATISDIQKSETAKSVGSFRLCPVQPNYYWYDGNSYEYNEYQIQFVAQPCEARIQWNSTYIGTTPFVYAFSGTLDKNERVIVRAIPANTSVKAQEASLKIRTELPRKVNFDFRTK